jgi:5-formyltetrahydrofolate cyclo-ligase
VAPVQSHPAKLALRDQLETTRSRRPLSEIVESAQLLARQVLAIDEVRRAATVAVYVARSAEPGTGPLLSGLVDAGKRVIVPILQPDYDLDWALFRSYDDLAPARLGLLEPTGEPLGREAIATADAVLVPALAVSSTGMRLGRGGGSYDRALGRVPVGTFTCALLYDDEVDIDVPVEPHDRPVRAAATPGRVVRFRRVT